MAVPHYLLNDKVVSDDHYNRLRVYGHHHSTHPLTTSIPQWDDGWGGSDDNNGPNDVVWAIGKFFFFYVFFYMLTNYFYYIQVLFMFPEYEKEWVGRRRSP